ncbi:hypothetical protein [Rhodanobacter sp. L36]|uniref:hypothetical protein n=1 Tax=Rhodanobacter sp. L36 TaxID=1747221 RepID=UPI00131DD230|nr:hypothetical protein [Rhodanobacter sp. L36]
MPPAKPFRQLDFLNYLEHLDASTGRVAHASMPPSMARVMAAANEAGEPSQAVDQLIELLKAHKAVWQASFDTDVVAGELRRYQKYAKPGQPSPHIVQLRQQQAVARQASSQSKQSFIKAASAFVRSVGIEVPQRMGLEVFIIGWIDANVPTTFAFAAE